MKLAIFKTFAIAVFAAFMVIGVSAQSATPSPSRENQSRPQGQDRRNLFRELGLTKEQRDQIRELRMSDREEVFAAQQKLREANKALDIAIYADSLNEQMIELRISERNQAQAEVNRLKTMSELNLRKLLTPEQLSKFREIREMYAKRQEEMKTRREAREKDVRQKRGGDSREP